MVETNNMAIKAIATNFKVFIINIFLILMILIWNTRNDASQSVTPWVMKKIKNQIMKTQIKLCFTEL